ncbi:hypothetical protein F2Q68_00035906 [Brassica cretica]|uniref:Transposase MuDR plant domain-containing protein n=1 Tax=Brassica cretica TaxID=69181 RepID=A0A8S9HAY2_BRACR|nr:hypothetical protein F2Q68_00035906 [Brassica cretica]
MTSLDDLLMMCQLHAVYGEWLLKDCRWDFVVDNVKGARIIFWGEGSTHAELLAMAQEDYNLDMSTESVEITYSLPAEMMQAPDTPPIHVTSDRQMMRQFHAVYGEWLLKDSRWDFVVDNVKGARIIFLGECSTHAKLLAMAQENYNLDMSTKSVEITYSLPAEMMLAPDTPPIHVASDRQVQNLLEITKTHGVRLCVSSRSKVETVSEFMEEDDKAGERFEDDDDDLVEDENHDGEEDDGEEDDGEEDDGEEYDGEEDADISIVAEADDNGEDYSVYGNVEDEDEEDDDMCFEDFKKNERGNRMVLLQNIQVNENSPCDNMSVGDRLAQQETDSLSGRPTRSVGDRVAQRRHCTPKYVGRLFIDRVGIIDELNPQHIIDAMNNMFGMTLDYTTSYKELLYAQTLMMRQLHAVYGEWLLKDCRWDFVVDNVKGARIIFWGKAPDTLPIHVTSDRQVQNLLEITKTHGVRFCVSSHDDDDLVEDENHDGEEDDGEEDDGEEDAGISIVAEVDENGEDYSVYGKVEDDDMCFEDIKKIEGGRSNGNSIYVNQSFVSKDALLSELRLIAVRFRFSFRIYKSTKTLLVTTYPVSGCQWKVRASVKHGANTFWVTKYVEKHTCSVGDRLAQRRHCTPKYVGRLFIDRVGIIDGLNLQHIIDAMKNMFGMTLDYTTSYIALLYAQTLVRGSAEDGCCLFAFFIVCFSNF